MIYLALFPQKILLRKDTEVLERFNKEIKRRTKVIGTFPNEGSILRLLVTLAIDTNAK